MKKTKVLIPALGILLLSTAATVSGSLAWFTANRSVTVQTTEFGVVNMNGALKCNVTAGNGTQLSGEAWSGTQVISAKDFGTESAHEYAQLTDASYNYALDVLYTDIPSDLGLANKFKVISTADYSDEQNNHVFYAFSWTIDFEYCFEADTTSMDLFFDPASVATATQIAASTLSTAKYTKEGFRLAMISATGAEKVWIPFKNRPESGADKRVTDVNTETDYESGIVIYGNDKTNHATIKTKAQDLVDTNVDRLDYLDTIDFVSTSTGTTFNGKKSGSETVSYKFVAWFDGLDASVVNEAELDKITTTLQFYVRQHKAKASA